MNYKERLNPWLLVELLPGHRVPVGRFRSQSDAEGHLKSIRNRMPSSDFAVIFDCHPKPEAQ
ncbi:MAG: hypothetical protein EA367_06730 [Leptolyngbya sp. DLM2.Bin15]|jgi:hypothetical protein|uniref:hypothetical protein n=1 Tax=Leptolyngbya sp. CCY15150 TaxID=2767772 RepID=UPI0013820905|nr:hypothetical protein [Leptolyngbya sp. CCY15150]MBF2090598.1 hypothetical protein [Synechococcales cyanobacterium K32_A2020_035]MBF2094926.1 hypothetical protein [Synechococcales cyanobacterium K44_A2020_017]TVQ21091.1 MAG: hypothetical protein EA367_06730 [Leptolyngbya sp. DLM2.Bin15]